MNNLIPFPAGPFFCAQDGRYLPGLTDLVIQAEAMLQRSQIEEQLLKLRLKQKCFLALAAASPQSVVHSSESEVETVNQSPASINPPAEESAEGFFWCGHCNHAIDLAADADPAGTYKCPRCKKHAVQWRFPSAARVPRPKMQAPPSPAVPACSEHAHELFASLKNAVS